MRQGSGGHPGGAARGVRIGLAAMAVGVAALLPAAVAASSPPPVPAGAGSKQVVTASPSRLLVRFRQGATRAQAAQARASVGASVLRTYHLVPGLELLKVQNGRAATAAAQLAHDPSVRYAAPDRSVPLQTTPDDPLFGQQWNMTTIGAPAAWGRSTGSAAVTVAVIDSGIDRSHPDLAANVWTNAGEIPNNNVDDDGNGYVDDVSGWDFVGGDNDPADQYGHGTAVSGVVGAVGNNGAGLAGVNWAVGLMPLRICNATCSIADEISALQYAVDEGASVVNASFGGYYSDQAEEDAIEAAGSAGVLYVAAAGNEAGDNDIHGPNPAGYPLDNIVSVAATTAADGLAGFSNYGLATVDLGAPGDAVPTTLATSGPISDPSGYGNMSGTSFSAPHVAGAAALLWALHPAWTRQQVRDRLLGTVQPVEGLAGRVASCGRLDLDAATDPGFVTRALVCVRLLGTGAGSVSSPSGIDCGSTCFASVAPGTQVTLTASPGAGSTFGGWSGACIGTGPCVVSPSVAANVTARFVGSGSPPGWSQAPLPPPNGVDPFPDGASRAFSDPFGVSLSADGTERAIRLFRVQGKSCFYDTSDTGGIYLQRNTVSGWVDDGKVTAPVLYSSQESVDTPGGSRWLNCSDFGMQTALSGDGSTLLVLQPTSGVSGLPGGLRCAAVVYRRDGGNWPLDGVLYPEGVGVGGTDDGGHCSYFGSGGSLSADGKRVVVESFGHVDVFLRANAGWETEARLVLPTDPGCGQELVPQGTAISGDGSVLLVSDPTCDVGGTGVAGRVYAYTRSGSTWTLAHTLLSAEPQTQNEFGRSVALSADGATAAIGVLRSNGFPASAGASWVFEHGPQGWQSKVRLSAETPEDTAALTCGAIVRNGARIVCRAFETVGLDPGQGAVYVFDRLGQSWAGGANRTRLYATDGFPNDALGVPGLGVSGDGTTIDAAVSEINVANGHYPHDRVGFEFRLTLPPPAIVSVSPQTAAIGSPVTITGTNLDTASWVQFGGAPAVITGQSATTISTSVPCAATDGPVSVGTPAGSDAAPFTVDNGPSPPTVTSITPAAARGGATITVLGSGLKGAGAVLFGCTGPAAKPKVDKSGTKLTVKVPNLGTSSVTLPLRVTTPGGTGSSAPSFHYVAPPTITGFAPAHGPPGTVVTISGTNLDGVTSVKFKGKTAGFSVTDPGHVTTTVPAKAKSGTIAVKTPGGSATSAAKFGVP